jgi:hypothetical protein
MQRHVDTYECEWKRAVETPEIAPLPPFRE